MTLQTCRVVLEGGGNFRDLGGYRAEDGRLVRWGMLFRSGSLAHLTAADRELLASLGIRTVCDLRTTTERASEPTSWKPETVRTLSWDYELDAGALMGTFRVGTPTPERLRAAVVEFYLNAPEEFADRLRSIFGLLEAQEVPLIMHCAAGKDRTGVAAAIVLRALGVAPQTVIEDYALSEGSIDPRLLRGEGRPRHDSWQFLSSLSPELRAPLVAAEPAYLKSMLDALDRKYGSLDGYLVSRLGLTKAGLGHIRDRYLEAA